MSLSLTTATVIVGVLLLIPGGLLLWNGPPVATWAKKSLRSKAVTTVVFGLAAVWFLYEITTLGEADFGTYKNALLLFFLAVGVASYFTVPDFLGVRGGAILVLMSAEVFRAAAYFQDPGSRLFMVAFVYVAICVALYLGAVPYKLRDFFDWLFDKNQRVKAFGGFFTGYGILLLICAATY